MYKKSTFLFSVCLVLISNTINSQVSFSENAATLGINAYYGTSDYGGGVSFVDFDNDGWDDITFASVSSEEIYFFKNTNGTFQRVYFSGISNTDKTKQVLWVDYDNDGDKDFFATAMVGENKFYKNNGNMTFTDISSAVGLFQDDKYTSGASFGDIDNDGDLDLFICQRDFENEAQKNYLYRNDNGIFTDISVTAQIIQTSELSFCSSFFDYNNDGFQDIYVANDKPSHPNRLYKNNGDNTFEDVSISSGAGIYINAMSTTIGDYNNDGWFDIYVTNTPEGNELLKNNGDGTFTNIARDVDVNFDSVGWGAVFLDADNDMFTDLYVSGSFDGSTPSLLPSAFYYNEGDDTFTIPSSIGFDNDTRKSHSNGIGDFNNDGKADIVVSNDADNIFLFKNTSANTNNWIKIKLEGTTGNKDGIGNVIEVFANGKSQYRYTLCGEGYLSQNSNNEFIGIGNATTIDYVKITWKHNGLVETINNVTPNQAITIQEGNGILAVKDETISSISVYPNPTNGIIEIQNLKGNTTIEIFDIVGKRMLTRSLTPNVLDITSYSKGIYLLKVKSNSKNEFLKIIKK